MLDKKSVSTTMCEKEMTVTMTILFVKFVATKIKFDEYISKRQYSR